MTLKYCVCDRLFFRIQKDHWKDEDGYHWHCPTCGRQIDREEGFVEPAKVRTFVKAWAMLMVFYYSWPFLFL